MADKLSLKQAAIRNECVSSKVTICGEDLLLYSSRLGDLGVVT